MVELLYGTGIRRDELINLLESNISVHEGTIKVLGKRAKERIIPIPKELVESINEYRKEKEAAGYASEFLLLTDRGKKLYPMFVHRCVTRYIAMVSSLDKNSPHVLRHSYATHLLNKGADINAIKELLGHASLAATQVYTHNSIERLKTIYKQAHPKG
jgi:integrase/recombinase XerC